jgi:hypothetical protein
MSAWEDFRINAEEYRELDNERVLVLVRWTGRVRRAAWIWGKCEQVGRVSSTSGEAE